MELHVDALALTSFFDGLIHSVLSSPGASAALICVVGLFALHRLMVSDNPLEWWHFISSKGVDGVHYADPDKLGKMAGIVVSSWLMVIVAKDGKMDATIFAVYLAYVGGVAGYSAYLRARGGLPPVDPPK